ncbi:gliding motility lipoprotein GldH [Marivirga sp. S37H4]|uniref:Gliding motility lipoprotein GldH n=1 Tax=Marivirga aurantiaca TaxID=2802615 RepID=A0A934X130_9BACT|nr:gliding motility lipoprotein GldH [Marivirga aurantiaca]MBK6267003.1 gliding motility lipoprotein GldH [Marivirga aurantiaca]
MNQLKKPLLIVLLWVAFACTEERQYEENLDFPDRIWQMDESMDFTFEIENDSTLHQLYLNLRNDGDYPYRNIYVHYTLKDSTDHVLDKKLQNIQLFHPKTGAPYGDGISNVYSHQVLLEDSVVFPTKGKFTVELKQYMRTDSLRGVYSVGIRVQELNSAE